MNLVRRLAEPDFKIIKQLLDQSTHINGIEKKTFIENYARFAPEGQDPLLFLYSEIESSYLPENQTRFLLGSFSDQGLAAMVGLRRSKTNPAWTLSMIVFLKESRLALQDALCDCIKTAEGWGLLEARIALPIHGDSLLTDIDAAFEKYHKVTETVITANRRPFYSSHYRLMSSMTWPMDILIHRYLLRDPHRAKISQQEHQYASIWNGNDGNDRRKSKDFR